MGALWRKLWHWLRRDAATAEIREELDAHADALARAFQEQGHSAAEAVRLARLRLGGAHAILERSQDEWHFRLLNGLGRDIQFAVRGLLDRPAFSLAAIATLALGIGASTAMFSVAYGVSLRPLPFRDPGRLLRVYESNPADSKLDQDVSFGSFHDWRAASTTVESWTMYGKPRTNALTDGTTITMMPVSPAFFDVLGVRPDQGTSFRPEREYTRFTENDVVITHETWLRVFQGRADIIGAPLTLDRRAVQYRVVGVLPEGFRFVEAVDAFMPEIVEEPVARILRNWRYDRVIARLKPGRTPADAQDELTPIAASIAHRFPQTNTHWTATVKPLREAVVGSFSRATWLLLAAVGLVLVVSCVNVGALLTARAMARFRDTAVRISLGAGKWRLARLWLAEAATLVAVGGVAGVGLAALGVAALKAAAPAGIPRLEDVAIDGPVLVVSLVVSIVAAVAFAVSPLLRLRAVDLQGALRAGVTSAGGEHGRGRLRTITTVAQCAGAAALVVLAGMVTRSYWRLTSTDLGWQPAHLLSLDVSPPTPEGLERPWSWYVDWCGTVADRLAHVPGIVSAAITTQVPLSNTMFPAVVARGRGVEARDAARWPAVLHTVTDQYFAVLQMHVVAGRTFQPSDRFLDSELNWSEPDQRRDHGVAVVSETVARTLWPGQNPIGQALFMPDQDQEVTWREVVGVVNDIQFWAVGETPALHVFLPRTQSNSGRNSLLVRVSGDPAAMTPAVRATLLDVRPGTKIDHVVTLDDLVAHATAQPRFSSEVASGFGLLALVLSAVGIYGTLAFLVGARMREIGIRLALGSSRRQMAAGVLRWVLVPACAGGAIGVVLAAAIGQVFAAAFYQMPSVDTASFATGAATLIVVVLIAALGPARRAATVDPIRVLRAD